MNSSLTAAMQARRHPDTTHIDRLATADMLAMLHQDDKQISEAVGACLPDIARLIDVATATMGRGGRLVIIGAWASGRTAIEAVSDYSPEGKHALVGLIAGGQTAAMAERETAANNYDLGAFELQSLDFSNHDMLLALTVSGKTPWVWARCVTPGRWGPLSLSSLSRRPARRRNWRISSLPHRPGRRQCRA
ncbi:glucokinase regulatory protein [Klebsiella variicola]|nr:glucokinase regulatory protein [Klebsiella variicola]